MPDEATDQFLGLQKGLCEKIVRHCLPQMGDELCKITSDLGEIAGSVDDLQISRVFTVRNGPQVAVRLSVGLSKDSEDEATDEG